MTTSDEEWKAHFESLETDVLLDLLASRAVKHREMIREIVEARGLPPDEIGEGIRVRKNATAKIVRESRQVVEGPTKREKLQFFLALIFPSIVFLGIYFLTDRALFLNLAVGGILGIIAGSIGGYIGGGIGGYCHPLIKMTDMKMKARLKVAKSGTELWFFGSISGMIAATLTSAFGDIYNTPLILVGIMIAAWIVFRFLAILVQGFLGGYITGLNATSVGGAVAGVLGGAAGVLLIDMISKIFM